MEPVIQASAKAEPSVRPKAAPRGPGGAFRGMMVSPLGAASAVVLGLVLALAVSAPIIWGDQAATIDTNALSQGPSADHPMGTDSLGRDILLRVLVATRLSISLALLATSVGVVVGVAVGALPWLLGGRAGRAAVTTINILVAFPAMLLVLFLSVIFGVGVKGAVLAVGFAVAPWFARLTSTLIAGVADRDFVNAAHAMGMRRVAVLRRHLLPNIAEPLIVNATVSAGTSLLVFSGLSFLGLGVQAPEYDWGVLLSEGLSDIYVNAAGALAPGVAIVVAGLAFNLVGETAVQSLRGSPVQAMETTATRASGRRDETDEPGLGSDDAGHTDRPALEVVNLRVTVAAAQGPITPVRGVTFSIMAGESVGLVGESGSGKSLTGMAVANLIEEPGTRRTKCSAPRR